MASATIGKSAAKSGSWARVEFLTSAPIRVLPSDRLSIPSSPGRRVTSITFPGAMAPVFIRSTRLVPPPSQAAPGSQAESASSREAGRT